MGKIYLVTGATGNIGSHVCAMLAGRGERLRALVLPGDGAAEQLPSAVERVEGDLLNAEAMERLFDVPEGTELCVIHIASIVTTYPGFVQRIYDVNVGGTRELLRRSRQAGVKRFVYVSSSSVIPELPRGVCQTEVSEFAPEAVLGFYAKTKTEATQAVKEAAREGLNASFVFPTAVCGPGDHAFGMMTQVMRDCAREKLPAGIVGGFDIVDVRDVASGIVLCVDRGRAGEGYLLAGHYLTLRELFSEVHRCTGAREVKTMLPLWFMKLLLPFFRLHYELHRRKPVFTSDALYNLTRNNLFSREKAERELGYAARPAAETIRDTLAWLRESGRLDAKRPKTAKTAAGRRSARLPRRKKRAMGMG